MSQRLISRSPDLKRLQDEGLSIRIADGALIVDHVPYLTAAREVRSGSLVSSLVLAGDLAAYAGDHTVWFVGDHPCNLDGSVIGQLTHSPEAVRFDGLVTSWKFSNKPTSGYADYFDKMTTYVRVIEGPAQAVDPSVTARRYLPIATDDTNESVFACEDTASSRVGIVGVGHRLRNEVLALIGAGGRLARP